MGSHHFDEDNHRSPYHLYQDCPRPAKAPRIANAGGTSTSGAFLSLKIDELGTCN
jgi:hypothetical protein